MDEEEEGRERGERNGNGKDTQVEQKGVAKLHPMQNRKGETGVMKAYVGPLGGYPMRECGLGPETGRRVARGIRGSKQTRGSDGYGGGRW